MESVSDIFKILSTEKKLLQPNHAYKPGEEGLLRAMYFFRWCNKQELKTLDEVANLFVKNKVPEQQIEHFGCALVMADSYETEESVKSGLKYINEKAREKTGRNILENIEPAKTERRIMKNILTTIAESAQRLESRTQMLKNSYLGVWVSIFMLLAVNLGLAFSGIYQGALLQMIPGSVSSSVLLQKSGGFIMAGVLFVVPSIMVLVFKRYKIMEHSNKASGYPDKLEKMTKALEEFKQKFDEMNK